MTSQASLSLSLLLTKVTHAQYRKRFRASYNTKIANKVLEKRQLRESVPNFKTKALAVQKLKGKEKCENEHRETASFMYNFVQKTNATKQLWWHFIPTSPLNFSTQFSADDQP